MRPYLSFMFRDRSDAGKQLASLLKKRGVEADVVFAIPRGGLPVAREVADALGLPLDVVVAKKLGAPHNPELAIGAVASDGSVWLNDDLVERIGIEQEYIEEVREREAASAREKERRYRDREGYGSLGRVLVVDDGIATGATVTACVESVRNAGADYVVVAAPVGSPDSVERLRDVADEVVCVETPPHFQAVGQFYQEFGQVSDDEALEYLRD